MIQTHCINLEKLLKVLVLKNNSTKFYITFKIQVSEVKLFKGKEHKDCALNRATYSVSEPRWNSSCLQASETVRFITQHALLFSHLVHIK